MRPTRFSIVLLAAGSLLFSTGCSGKRIVATPVYFPPAPASAHAVHLVSFNAMDEIVAPEPTVLEVLRGQPLSPFVTRPAGIAYRDGRLYIADAGVGAVHCWDLEAKKARWIGRNGDEGQLRKPVAVAVDEAGVVYVADTERNAVIVFGAGGVVTEVRAPEREAYRPVAAACHGDRLYVADISAHQIDVFSTPGLAYVESFNGGESDDGPVYFPMGLATDDSGDVFVSDMMNARVRGFSPGFEQIVSMGQPGDHYGDMGKPRQLAVGPDDVLFIADAGFAHVHLFTTRGELLMLLGGPGAQAASTPMPSGVAVARSLPASLQALVPEDFQADYYLFIANSIGEQRLSLYAMGTGR